MCSRCERWDCEGHIVSPTACQSHVLNVWLSLALHTPPDLTQVTADFNAKLSDIGAPYDDTVNSDRIRPSISARRALTPAPLPPLPNVTLLLVPVSGARHCFNVYFTHAFARYRPLRSVDGA